MILAIAEPSGKLSDTATLETLHCAGEIAAVRSSAVTAVAAGRDTEGIGPETAEMLHCDIMLLEGEGLARYSAEGYAAAIARLVERLDPTEIVVPGTSRGVDLAPYLAIRIGAAYISGITGVRGNGPFPVYTRPCWHGKMEMDVASRRERTVITVQPGSFSTDPMEAEGVPRIERIPVEVQLTGTEPEGTATVSHGDDTGLAEAEVIVSAGRGVGRKENLSLLRELASLFPRSAIGASRPVCDYGWLPYGRQVGQTGKSVSPRLYIACGISGSMQHLAGMKSSGNIVAVNNDADAPIFRHAHAGVVEDLATFLQEFLDLARRKGKGKSDQSG
jgi:electron transfer flavoprotein alpha subunit